MGTNIPKAQLQESMTNGQQPDIVLQALNKTAPPFGPLGSEPKQHYPPCINPSCKSYGRSHPNCRCYGGASEHSGVGEAGHFAEGGEVKKEYYCDNDRPHFKNCEYYSEGGDVKGVHKSYYDDNSGGESKAGALARNIDLGKGRKENAVSEHHKVLGEMKAQSKPKIQGMADGGESGDDKLSDSEKLDLAKQAVASEAPQGSNPQPNQDINIPETSAPDTTVPQAQQATQPQESDQTAQPQAGVSNPGPDYNSSGENISDPVTQVQNAKQAHLQDLLDQSGTFNNELNQGQITPQHYFHLFGREGTLGKIGTAFGLMLGGIGSGLTHQPNAALQVMQNEIDNDLKAQELSSANKQNFLKINQQGFLNRAQEAQMSQETKTKAYALTRMQMNNAALHSLVQNASKLPPGTPQRQQADAQLAMLNQGVQNENFNIADRAATASALGGFMSGGQGNGQNTTIMKKSGLLGPEAKEVGQDVEEQYVVAQVDGQKHSSSTYCL